jgi:hypothetical protein
MRSKFIGRVHPVTGGRGIGYDYRTDPLLDFNDGTR